MSILTLQCYQHRFFGWKIHVSDPRTETTVVTTPVPIPTTTSEPTVPDYGKLIGSFEDRRTLHDVAGTVYAIDNTRIWMRGFTFDGRAPDAHFYVGSGDTPNEDGISIPDENGLTTKLSAYSNDNFILTLPDGITLQNIRWISVWCVPFRVDFGSVIIPENFDPPAPKSLGELGFNPRVHNVHADDVIILNTKQITFVNLDYDGRGPDAYFWTGDGLPDPNDRRISHPVDSSAILPQYNGENVTITFPDDLTLKDVDFIGLWCVAARQNFGHLPIVSSDVENIPPFIPVSKAPEATGNCQVLLEDTFHISWIVDSEDNKITLTFQGVVEEGEYMAFGRSGQDSFTSMVGSDVTVVWIDPNTQDGQAQDYYLNAYSQCIPGDGRGACPDTLQGGVGDVTLQSAEVKDGVTIITVERPLTTGDPRDRDIPADGDVTVSWGIGYINPTGHVAKHHTRAIGTVTVNFGSTSDCPVLTVPTAAPEPVEPWIIEPLYPTEDTPMVAVIGPAGGRRGYQGIVDQVGWGLAWYVNGSIIPEIHVERGKTYTFQVYGGNDPSFLGTYHPFYISDSKDGGYEQKTELEKQLETIYAGPVEGTLCEYKGNEDPEDYENFDDYLQTLNLECLENAQPGVLRWTVAEDTPDLVYYQCYQHRFFGWKIHVSGPRTDTTTVTTPLLIPTTTPAQTVPYYGKLIGSFEDRRTLHDVAGTVYAIDNTRIWMRGFTFDGRAPDAHFYVGSGDTPNENGMSIPDENGLTTKLSAYSNDNFILTLPDGITLQNIRWISVWCVPFRVDFGSVIIPANFDPPAPKSLGELGFNPRVHNVHADDVIILNTKQIKFVKLDYDGRGPDAYFWTGDGMPDPNDKRISHPVDSSEKLPQYDGEDVTITFPDDVTVKDVDFIGLWCVAARQNFGHLPIVSSDVENIPPFIPVSKEPEAMGDCQVLLEDAFHISWIVDAGNNKITLTFQGVVEEGEYMAFGRSGQDSFTSMVGSDVTVVWIDPNTHDGQAQDYYLNAYSQCIPGDGRGACPDTLQGGDGDVTLQSAEVKDGVTIITVERPLTTGDPTDRDIPTTGDVTVSWGIGYINPTGHVAKHHTRAIGTVTVNFGSTSDCPALKVPTAAPEPVEPWTIEPLYPTEDTPMVAVIGPAGGRRGYQGIVDQVGWGLAWYINGSIIPEIDVERGKTYTFQVYGGNDPSFLGTYHPFYISDSKDGGFEQKTEREKQLETIYAGPVEGTLCEYRGNEDPEDYENFDDYLQTLNLDCLENAQPGVLRWTVAEDTPDLVYYQCYQHRFFGWKIHVSGPRTDTTAVTRPQPIPTTKSAQTVPYYGKLIGSFEDRRTLHDVAGTVYAIDNTRIWMRGFTFDGRAPDAHFYVGSGDTPNENGMSIPDENGLTTKLSSYSNDDFILTLPDGITLQNIGWISVWCIPFRVDFGSVIIPANFDPPAPKSLGELGFNPRVHNVHADDVIILNTKQIKFVKLDYDGRGPDAYFWTGDGMPDPNDKRISHPVDSSEKLPQYDGEDVTITFPDDVTVKDVDFIGLWCVAARQNFGHLPIVSSDVENIPPFIPVSKEPEAMGDCQVLLEDAFHISWIVDAGNNKITLTFQGVVEEGEYMAFGRSGQDSFTSMVGSDVTVVWIDSNTHDGQAQDYYLNEYSQCIPGDGRGACPDTLQGGDGDVTLQSAEVKDGVTIITVERPLTTGDPRDRDIPTTGDVTVSWGIGYINPTGHVAKHHTRAIGTVTVNFGSTSDCPALTVPTAAPEPVEPWTIEPLYPTEDTPMVAVIGPAGGRRGYQGIVDQVGWGLAWYINGSIIPEIHVERGKTYTFEVYGGNDPSFLGTYHPFYISDSKDGGFEQKTEREKQLETIYAGPVEGTLCEYKGNEDPEDYENFDDYLQTLNLECLENAQPGVLRWTVAEDTPDLVYYQCYQHRFFGWKIHVSGPRTDTTAVTRPQPIPTTKSVPTVNEYGKLIGSFGDRRTLHNVAGTVYAIDNTRIWMRGFTFDGIAPDAHFYVGSGDMPNANGIIIPDENGLTTKLSSYSNDNFILTLPDGINLQNIEWISVWCIPFRVDFGSVLIPANFDPPAPKTLGELGFSPRVHNVHADDVIILNTKQIKFVNLDYDGFGPAAYFWTGDGTPDLNDRRIPHPLDSTDDLPRYNGAEVTITFPDDLTVKDVDFIGLWCVAARQNFGHLPIASSDVENIPPFVPDSPTPPAMQGDCQVLLEDTFHISWIVDAANNKITLTFQGVVEEGEYMAFGRSGHDSFTSMVGSDVTVVWIDRNTHKAQAQDYYLNDYSQCIPDNGRGACPDVLQDNGVDDVTLKNAEVRNGVTIITVERPLTTDDPTDRDIPTTGEITVSWGIGFINPTGHVAKHHTRAIGTVTVKFGSSSDCPVLTGPTVDPRSVEPWTIEPLYPSENTPMVAVIGPAGGRRGYQGIAGQVGWGLAWYINGRIIPEIHVERNKTYTFLIYGGNDPSFLGTYHPFYISDSKDGGYDQKTESEKLGETIYARPEEGTLCEYNGNEDPEDYDGFEDYFKTLTLECPEKAQPGVLRWTVAEDTPDLVYYQCYQHRFFGWKIHVSGKDEGSNENGANMVASYSLVCVTIISVLSTSILWLENLGFWP